jgi:hypothetical protein
MDQVRHSAQIEDLGGLWIERNTGGGASKGGIDLDVRV